MLIPKQVASIIEETAKEFNLPVQVIEEIYRAQFITFRDNMKTARENNFPTIMLPNFGKFYSNPVRRQYIQKLTENKLKRNGEKNNTKE